VLSSAAAEDLALLQRWPGGLVILTDPDVPGRELRLYLDDRLAQASGFAVSKAAAMQSNMLAKQHARFSHVNNG
jgi:5S rRNA maturation endonuclease (ribonuclease M5)